MTVSRHDQARSLIGRKVRVSRVSWPAEEDAAPGPSLRVGDVLTVAGVHRTSRGFLSLEFDNRPSLLVGWGDRFDVQDPEGKWVPWIDEGPPDADGWRCPA